MKLEVNKLENNDEYNFDLLRSLDYDSMVNLITDSIPDNCEVLRIHVGGDMFNQAYFDAWLQVASLSQY